MYTYHGILFANFMMKKGLDTKRINSRLCASGSRQSALVIFHVLREVFVISIFKMFSDSSETAPSPHSAPIWHHSCPNLARTTEIKVHGSFDEEARHHLVPIRFLTPGGPAERKRSKAKILMDKNIMISLDQHWKSFRGLLLRCNVIFGEAFEKPLMKC